MAVKELSGEQFFDSLALATGYRESPNDRGFGRERTTVRTQFLEQFAPRGRLSEYAQIMRRAIDAIRGEDVEPFAGRYYKVSQFRFFGTPEPDLGPLKLYLAAVGPKMTALAA